MTRLLMCDEPKIREGAADALAGLDARLALLRGDHEEDAVIAFCGADFPLVERGVGDVFDALAFERTRDEDDDGEARRLARLVELVVERGDLGRGEHPRRVDHVAVQRRRLERCRRDDPEEGRQREHERDDAGRADRHESPM